MPYDLNDKLVVAISSRALFDLEEEDRVYREVSLAAYRALQREREDVPLRPGTGFRLVKGLLAINRRVASKRLVEVIILSKNDGDAGARIFSSARHHGLDITRAAFTGGRPTAKFLEPFCGDLFLSAEATEVAAARAAGIPAALVLDPPDPAAAPGDDEVLIAFDGDSVLFDDEADRINDLFGLDAFLAHEEARADIPMSPGPFEPFLRALARVQAEFPEGEEPIRTALVTARNAPAHRRVINTLRAWGVRIDESYFLGGVDKGAVLKALRPHIMFDDRVDNLRQAQATVATAHVPYAGSQHELFPSSAVETPVVIDPVAAFDGSRNEPGDDAVTPIDTEPVTAAPRGRDELIDSIIDRLASDAAPEGEQSEDRRAARPGPGTQADDGSPTVGRRRARPRP